MVQAQVSGTVDDARAVLAARSSEDAGGLAALQSAGARLQAVLPGLVEEAEAQLADGPASLRELWQLLVELQQLRRELLERRLVRRADGVERAAEALDRLGALASPGSILTRAATELGEASDFDRVIVSRIDGRVLRPASAWSPDERAAGERIVGALAPQPMALEYPRVEHELAAGQARDAQLVDVGQGRADAAWTETLGWTSYVVGRLVLGGKVIGMVHADCARSARALDAVDREVVDAYAEGLGPVFERAVLRDRVRRHQAELDTAARWMTARASGLSDVAPLAAETGSAGVSELLTARELDVVRLIARGHTNRAIAEALVISEGTVKYHVKNLLRKLGARNRADAVARFEGPPAGSP